MKLTLLVIVLVFASAATVMHLRGRVRLKWSRQAFDHSTFMAPVNVFMLAFSKVPRTAYLPPETFPDLKLIQQHWPEIREEALAMSRAMHIKAAQNMDDVGFNSFFKTGWGRFYLKWYGQSQPHASALQLCPKTAALVDSLPSIKMAMFTELPDGATLGLHRDPYSGSLRYHLGLDTPNGDPRCYIEVDGQRYSWRDGEGVVFDETYLHHASNTSGRTRIIFMADVDRPMTNRFAAWVNRGFGHLVVAAGASPNEAGDPTGLMSRLFRISHYAGQARRAYKAWNPTVYKLTKVALLLGIVALFIWG